MLDVYLERSGLKFGSSKKVEEPTTEIVDIGYHTENVLILKSTTDLIEIHDRSPFIPNSLFIGLPQ